MKKYLIKIILIVVTILTATDILADTIPGGYMSGTLTLTDNTYIQNIIRVKSGTTLTIDLNGMVLSGKGLGEVINVEVGGKLIIKDSNPTVGHAGSINSKGIFMWPKVTGQTQHNVYGGIICNKYEDDNTNRKGISVSGECIIESGKIMGCFSTTIGAAATMTSSGKFTMLSGEIAYNYSKKSDADRGGVLYGNEPVTNNGETNSGSSISISNTAIYNNKSEGNGGVIYCWNVTLNNCNIQSNSSEMNGGVVYLHSYNNSGKKSSLTITESDINSNTSGENGGAIYSKGSNITITDSHINSNTSGKYGGGVYTDACELNIDRSEVNYNDANGIRGGGVYALNTNVTIYDSKLNGNEVFGSGAYGGAIVVTGNLETNTCNITRSEINSNYADTYGGGIYSNIPTIISDSQICYNRSMATQTPESKPGHGRGGGFEFTNAAEFELINTVVEYNVAMWYGGGGQVDNNAKLIMKGSTKINNNKVLLHGAGGLHLTSNAHLVLESGEISYNEASTVGGAIHSSYGCTLELNGGEIKGNIAHQRGGGVHINTGGELTMNGTDILNNKVYKGYDIVYCTVIRNSDGTYSWTTPEHIISGSSYELDQDGYLVDSGYGGGVLIDSGTFTMNSGKLSGNYAQKAGGGLGLIMIRISDNTKDFATLKVVNFIMNNGIIANNTCDGNGAGVFLMRNRIPDMIKKLSADKQEEFKKESNYNALMTGKPSATINKGNLGVNSTLVSGGAIMMEEGNFFVSGETNLQNNSSGSHGGGIYIGGGSFTVNGSGDLVAVGNISSDGNGGALYLGNGTFTAQSGSSIVLGNANYPNKALNGNGGGIYCAGAFTMNGSAKADIHNNSAMNGGAIYATGNVTITGNTSISNNTATSAGGAIFVQGATITSTNATLTANNNQAVNGGVFYVNNGSVSLGTASMTANKATSNGGAIALYNGAFSMASSSNIRNNAASNFGGGLYVYNQNGASQKTISCTGGTFSGNTAKAGGAVCADGNIKLTLAASMEANTANIGGGIYMANGVQMTFGEGLIRSNTASKLENSAYATASGKDHSTVSGVGGGIFMANGSSLVFNSSEMGIYNNFATNAGADICSNGTNTTITLPAIGNMSLRGFDVPGNDLYWVYDYFKNDDSATNLNGLDAMRYEDMLLVTDPTFNISAYILDKSKPLTFKNYACLDLGYDLIFVDFIVTGLASTDNAAINMSYPRLNNPDDPDDLSTTDVLYRKVLFNGSQTRTVGLPSGSWKFNCPDWALAYEKPTYNGKSENTAIDLNRQHRTVSIVFTPLETEGPDRTKAKVYEAFKVNRMEP